MGIPDITTFTLTSEFIFHQTMIIRNVNLLKPWLHVKVKTKLFSFGQTAVVTVKM